MVFRDAVTANTSTLAVDETLLAWPDYAIAAIVAGASLARQGNRPVTCVTGSASAVPRPLLSWPQVPGVVAPACVSASVRPAVPAEQIVAIATLEEMDRLIGRLVPTVEERGGPAIDATYLLVETAVSNAIEFSDDHCAYVGWAVRAERLELAVGDIGPGIAATAQGGTAVNALDRVFNRYIHGRPAGGLTRLHDFLRRDLYGRQGYLISGDEEHECGTYLERSRTLGFSGLVGPTLFALSL